MDGIENMCTYPHVEAKSVSRKSNGSSCLQRGSDAKEERFGGCAFKEEVTHLLHLIPAFQFLGSVMYSAGCQEAVQKAERRGRVEHKIQAITIEHCGLHRLDLARRAGVVRELGKEVNGEGLLILPNLVGDEQTRHTEQLQRGGGRGSGAFGQETLEVVDGEQVRGPFHLAALNDLRQPRCQHLVHVLL